MRSLTYVLISSTVFLSKEFLTEDRRTTRQLWSLENPSLRGSDGKVIHITILLTQFKQSI